MASSAAAVVTPTTPLLRGYQERIVDIAKQANTIVLLPTGAGKTWIAADALVHVGTPAVFFVPTIPLVVQQAAALRARPNMPPRVGEYHGDVRTVPCDFDVLVTTPKAFEVAQASSGGASMAALGWGRFKVVVFDEVHHVIKDHPYRSLALKLRHSGFRPRVIGLTASLTYAVGDTKKISKSVQKLCDELNIERIEHATDEELRHGGYQGAGRAAVAEVRLPPAGNPAVRVNDLLVPNKDRLPHLMHETFFKRIQNSTATTFGQDLVHMIRVLENAVKAVDDAFQSPLTNISLRSWGEYAHERAARFSNLYNQLEHWYEALRLLVISWEEHDDAAVTFLCMMKCNQNAALSLWSTTTAVVKEKIQQFFTTHPVSSSLLSDRFDNMCRVLLEKMNTRPNFRGIIFVQQRVMTHIIKYVIENRSSSSSSSQQQQQDPPPLSISRIKARCLYSTKSPATPSLSVTKLESRQVLEAFSSGQINLLITTSVAEEGLDVPAANCVIYFDAIHHAVSYVQGRGRARQANSSFVVLNQRHDRPATLLAQQEREQHAIASSFSPINMAAACTSNPDVELQAAKNREQNAAKFLCNISEKNALGNLNIYVKKTKADVQEVHELDATSWTICRLTYRSFKRNVSADGKGAGKKTAKKKAAGALLQALYASTRKDPL